MKIDVLTTLLEGLWAAKVFNQHADNKVALPILLADLIDKLTEYQFLSNYNQIESSIVYENITLKEYAQQSVINCLKSGDINRIAQKKASIEQDLGVYDELFLCFISSKECA
jgi:hypothetical protein